MVLLLSLIHLPSSTRTSRTMNSCVYCACFMCAFLFPGSIGQSQRLVNGTSKYNGRLEIFYNTTWNTVCNDHIDKKEAQVACRMLGFNSSRALALRAEMYGEGSGPILLDEVQCQGSETSLMQCQHNGFYKHDCSHFEDLAIICSRQREHLRLTGKDLATPHKGRVEILLEGEWYTMCVPDVHISTVMCRQLGLPSDAAVPLKKFSPGPLVSPKLMSGLKCMGHENSVIDCDQTTYNSEGWRNKICTSDSEYYGVFCVDYPSLFIHANGSRYPVMEGTDVTLKCMSEHWPNVIKYTWPENAGALANDNDLIIENVNRTHNGKLVKCLAVSSDGVLVSSDTLKLQVYYQPIITIHMVSTKPQMVFSDYYQVMQGQNITFWCNTVSNPLPASITWSGRVNSTTGLLRIIAAEEKRHNGVYTCTVVTRTVDEDERLPLTASSQVTIDVAVGQSQRLVNGTSKYNGRLEIFYNTTWNTVCNDRVDKKEAQVACRMLGFHRSRALAVRAEMYGEGSGPILLDEVWCQGLETSLMQCQHNGFYKHDCFHFEDLAIICSRQQERLRLTGKDLATPHKGRVEILLEGEWYTMCVPDLHISTVICSQLGLPSEAAVPLKEFSPGPLVSPKLMSGLKCMGHENSVIECDQTTYNNEGWRNNICTSDSDYYGVFCVDSPSLFIHANGSRYPVMEGTDVTLKCMSEHWSNVTNYTWPENAGALANDNDLIIENVNRTHNGKLVKCLAVSSDGVLVSSDTLKLQVYYQPIITIQMASTKPPMVFSDHYQVMQGQSITFSCNAVSNPLPASITWSGRVNSTTEQLQIIAAEKKRHNGVYTCTVVTRTVDEDERLPLTASSQLTINVTDPGGFVRKSTDMVYDKTAYSQSGEKEWNYKLTLRSENSLGIYLKRRLMPLLTSSLGVRGKNGETISQRTKPSDAIPHLRIMFNENSFPPLEGTNVTLECESTQSGQSEATYLWFKYSRKRIRSHYGKYLIFNNVTRDHHGLRVYCAANFWYSDFVYYVASDTMIMTVSYGSGKIPSSFLLTFEGALAGGIVIVATVAVFCVRHWKRQSERMVDIKDCPLCHKITLPLDRLKKPECFSRGCGQEKI